MVSVFRYYAQLALIESKVYSELYSARSRLRSIGERSAAIARIDSEIERFKDGIALGIRPRNRIICPKSHFMAVVLLYFIYYDCLETIYRASVHHQSWFTEFGHAKLQPEQQRRQFLDLKTRLCSNTDICISAARSTVGLVKYLIVPQSQLREGLYWMIVYYPLSACLAFFANLIRNPEDPNANEDLTLIRHALDFLSNVMTTDKSIAARRTFTIFEELHRTARVYVEKSLHQTLQKERRKRLQDQTSAHETCYAEDDLRFPPEPNMVLQSQHATTTNRSASKANPSFDSSKPNTTATIRDELSFVQGMGHSEFEWELSNLWGLA